MGPTLDFRGDGRKPFRQGFRQRLLEVYGKLLDLTRAERSPRLTGTPLRSPDPSQEIYAERREKLSVVANPEQREPSRRPA
jgi:hypothetical protein